MRTSQIKLSGMDAAEFEPPPLQRGMPNVGAQDPVRHDNHGGCIQSAPNSLLKQIQLQLAS